MFPKNARKYKSKILGRAVYRYLSINKQGKEKVGLNLG